VGGAKGKYPPAPTSLLGASERALGGSERRVGSPGVWGLTLPRATPYGRL